MTRGNAQERLAAREKAVKERDAFYDEYKTLDAAMEKALTEKDTAMAAATLDQMREERREIDKMAEVVCQLSEDTDHGIDDRIWKTKFQRTFLGYQRRAEFLMEAAAADIEAKRRPAQINTTQGNHKSIKTNLPILNLKTFRGDISEWTSWWESFCISVHNNPDMPDKYTKFTYLVHFTSHDAHDLIKGFRINEANYDFAIKELQECFGRDDVIKESHFQAISQLAPVSDLNDVVALWKLYNGAVINVRSLEGLGVDETSYKLTFKPMILGKLPQELTIEWYKKEHHASKGIHKLLAFIKSELQGREDAALLRKNTKPSQPKHSQGHHHSKKEQESGLKSTAVALAAPIAAAPPPNHEKKSGESSTSYKGESRSKSCNFCGGEHYAIHCSLSVDKRWDVVKREKRCHICLRTGHRKTECRAKRKCNDCTESHHSALHFEKKKDPPAGHSSAEKSASTTKTKSTPAAGASMDSSATTVSAIIKEGSSTLSTSCCKHNHSLLMTATIWIEGGDKRREAFCMVDGCSHRTYIRTQFAEEMNLKVVGTERLAVQAFGSQEPGEMKNRKKFNFAVRGMFPNARAVFMTVVDEECMCPAPAYIKTRFAEELHDGGNHLADNRFFHPDQPDRPVDLLIGMDYYYSIIEGYTRSSPEGLRAVPSKFGWILHGPSKKITTKKSSITNSLFISSMELPDMDVDESGPPSTSSTQPTQPTAPDVFITLSATATTSKGEEGKTTMDQKEAGTSERCTDCRRMFWKLESMGIGDPSDQADAPDPLDGYSSKIKRSKSGRMVAPLPWNDKKSLLQPHIGLARGRMNNLLSQLRKKPNLLAEYHSKIQEAIKEGFVAEADLSYKGTCTYLPHHAVERPDKLTTKVRPVFDGSAHTSYSPSINDCLHNGPNLNPELLAVLLRFRCPAVVWTADIEKAFHQIELAPEDSEAIRFLWVENPADPHSPVKHYVWKRLPFGLICSPFILRAVINSVLDEFTHIYPDTVTLFRNQLYVDDMLGGARSADLALQTIAEMKEICASAGMTLRKWTTNDSALQKELGEEEEDPAGALGRALSGINSPKVLGLTWDSTEDCFRFQPQKIIDIAKKLSNRPTKRQVSQIAARIFDPMGHLGPVTIVSKIIFSKIWETGTDWDELIPEEFENDWNSFISGLVNLSSLKIPRRVLVEGGSAASAELLIFGDASEKAYGAVAYLRSVTPNGTAFISMLMSKTRVAPPPPRKLTIPRLELLAAQLAATLAEYIHTTFRAVNLTTTLWSDSTIALAWIKSDKQRRTYVQNRVNDIKSKTKPSWWSHCPGEINPADLASRGTSAEALVASTLWWNGPNYEQLTSTVECEHPTEEELERAEIEAERRVKSDRPKRVTICAAAVVGPVGPPPPPVVSKVFLSEMLSRFSRFDSLCRATAFLLRFIKRARGIDQELPAATTTITFKDGCTKQVPCLSAAELEEAAHFWVAQAQRDAHPEEYHALSKGLSIRGTSDLAPLRPIWDATGRVIRVTGWIQPSLDAPDAQPPVLLPTSVSKKGARGNPSDRRAIIDLIIRDAHTRVFHFGLRTTLAELRERYHCVQGRQMVKRVLQSCTTCKKINSRPFDAPAADLPRVRTTECRPFEVTGVDFAGPLFVRPRYESDKTNLVKTYVCLFTCATTRAVHLELVEDLTTYQFLLAIRRFFGIRGAASLIYSDNAKTFKLAANYFQGLEQDGRLQDFLSGRRLQWRFSANLAPWWGGFWERLVRTVKKPLKKTIGRANLSFSELETTLIEVSFAINSRPLTYVADGSDGDPAPLTPFHLITGYRPSAHGRLPVPAEADAMPGRDALVRRELKRRRVLEKWWVTFRSEYLKDLAQFQAPGRQTRSIRRGELVLVKDNNKKRFNWPMAVVTALESGTDGRVRMVSLRTYSGLETNRPIQSLYPLEIVAPTEEESLPDPEPVLPPTPAVESAPTPEPDTTPVAVPPQCVGIHTQQQEGDVVERPPEDRRTRRGRLIRPPPRLDL